MKSFTAIVERDPQTQLYVGWVPGLPGGHSQAATLDELRTNLQEVIELLLEEGEVHLESEFVGTQTLQVG
ncbi:MAG TPA: type II toxin-antitoxin system HicB family antitoxin [Terriglobales bacterium]|nr:type II toxin-antitoxin system HicB family antitoxin [Terriglobales bacterium]